MIEATTIILFGSIAIILTLGGLPMVCKAICKFFKFAFDLYIKYALASHSHTKYMNVNDIPVNKMY